MKISIIIPVYNAAKYLRECLDSVCVAAEKVEAEIICVDDGSTDGSGEILDSYVRCSTHASSTFTFKVVHQKNGGEGVARNIGLGEAGGNVIAWVDADDLLDPDVLEEVQDIFNQNDADMVRVRHKRFRGDTCDLVRCQRHEVEKVHGVAMVRNWAIQTLVREGYCWVTFWRRDKLLRAFPIGIQYAGDSLFTLANASDLEFVIQSEYVGYYYRDTPGSIMKKPFPSAERVRFLRELKVVAGLYGFHSPRFSWMGWFNLMNWVVRHADTKEAKALHGTFNDLVNSDVVVGRDLAVYARPAFVLYVKFGWCWPIRMTYAAVGLIVRTRDVLLKRGNA